MFLLIFLILPFVNADVISLNSGGSEDLVINPDTYVEGFFGCVPTTCSKLGYECDSWGDGCAKTLNCGSCASGFSCSSGSCVADVVTPPGDTGGGGGAAPSEDEIFVSPSSINVNLAINTNKRQMISVENLKSVPITVSISQTDLNNMIIIENTSLSLAAGETKSIGVIFVALNDTGIFTGTIKIGGVTVPVSLNIKTKLLLFDSNIVVLNRNYQVSQESDLRTRVTLIPMGDEERLDVLLNYVIKDYSGKIYLTQSESVLVEKKMNLRKNFGTGSLPLGTYIVGLELVYPGGVAPSSAHFEVVETTATDFLGIVVFILLLFILVVLISMIALIIIRKRKQAQAGQ